MGTTKGSELLPGTLDLLILKILTVGPPHGYGIARHLETVSDDVLQVGEQREFDWIVLAIHKVLGAT